MSQSTREINITRIFDAPKNRVWSAWTDPDLVRHWWGPKGFTTPYCTIDFRVGGKYLNCMHSPEGQDYWSTGTYREIVNLERIVNTDSFADKEGNIVSAATYGITPAWPDEALITLTFKDQGGKTRFTLKHADIPAGKDGDLCEDGWNETLDRLAEYLNN